jgi:hypothetical protein
MPARFQKTFSACSTSPPALGRTFSADEYQSGRDQVVVLSHGVWQRLFNSDAQVVGKTIELGGRAQTIIGVLPLILMAGWKRNLVAPIPYRAGETGTPGTLAGRAGPPQPGCLFS